MKDLLKRKYKIFFLCLMVLLTCTACSNPRGKDGKTKADQIISYEEIQIDQAQVNIEEVSDPETKAAYEEELKSGNMITIQPTSWSSAWKNGWFDGLIVWPIAQLINWFASFTDAGWGIILATLLIQLLIYVLTYKSQLSQQRMQEIQPQLQRIQDKYQGKNDDRSKMLMAQEMQKLYADNDIHPFGSMLVMFIQLPVMMGMFYATMRAATTVYGSFMGMSLAGTPLEGFTHMQWGPVTVYILMIVMSIVSMQLPKWLSKWEEKKNPKPKKKHQDNASSNMMGNTMNMTMYMSTALIGFMYLSWPLAMSFYWLVSSIIRSGLQVVSHIISEKHQSEKAIEQKQNASGILKNKRK